MAGPLIFESDLDLVNRLIETVPHWNLQKAKALDDTRFHVVDTKTKKYLGLHATRPLSHCDVKEYFRPDIDLNTIREHVYPLTGEPDILWDGSKVTVNLEGWELKYKKTPPNMNIPCLLVAISRLEEINNG